MLTCPACGHQDVLEKMVDQTIEYGMGEEAVDLLANVPLCRCSRCGLEYTDYRAEEILQELISQLLTKH